MLSCVSIAHSFLLPDNLIMGMDCGLFFRLSVDGYLSCLQFGAIMNKAALDIHGQVFVWTDISFMVNTQERNFYV